MDSVVRAIVVYGLVWALFRVSGKRTLSEATTFDFVLLLIIAETTQQALLGEDYSITNAFLLVTTLIGIDVALSLVKRRFPRFDKVMDGQPIIIVENGRPLEDRMRQARVDEADILEAARRLQGLERMEQIKYAVLEQSGGISIVPRSRS
ncbi:MAG TPA: DUF421 domain-containing protein [Bryobacteraceae bacterium]|nr:DUF421 domain-containing protein [Bryobacteraceae bacterium]HOQ43854.1 DUF421 domain-containing protein [Bryobacteraceae bacterium]HPQ17584.1 DUF421 domain-containing protein [Bryobacteraceae bacterium]HPU71703.1 DUF421 domain-containing protein [Bryobacteraceae bacterium]